MSLTATVVLLGLVAVLVSALAVRVLWRTDWFRGFLRGCAGLAFLFIAVAMGLIAFDLYSYHQLLQERPVATLSFRQLDSQQFEVQVRLADRDNSDFYRLQGDMWQVDARFIKWRDLLARAGLPPAYRLERISGRYADIEHERNAPRSVYALSGEAPLDVWTLLRESRSVVALADTEYGSATFLPMTDGAEFTVYATFSGLLARPSNPVARDAVQDWSS